MGVGVGSAAGTGLGAMVGVGTGVDAYAVVHAAASMPVRARAVRCDAPRVILPHPRPVIPSASSTFPDTVGAAGRLGAAGCRAWICRPQRCGAAVGTSVA